MSATDDCNCAERWVNGGKVPRPKLHDCEYIRRRNQLIAEAERFADNICDDPRCSAWLEAFSRRMDDLAKENRLYREARKAAPPVEARKPAPIDLIFGGARI